MEKVCTKCNKSLDISNFRSAKNGKFGVRSKCRKCDNEIRRDRWRSMSNEDRRNLRKADAIKYTHGITLQQYNDLLEKQNNKCLICGKEEVIILKGNVKKLCVDHCHTTGKIRGLLCNSCNVGIGCFKDDLELMQKAIDYVKVNKDENSRTLGQVSKDASSNPPV